MVDETGLDKPKVDETAVDEPGPHQYDYTACMHAWLSPDPFVKKVVFEVQYCSVCY